MFRPLSPHVRKCLRFLSSVFILLILLSICYSLCLLRSIDVFQSLFFHIALALGNLALSSFFFKIGCSSGLVLAIRFAVRLLFSGGIEQIYWMDETNPSASPDNSTPSLSYLISWFHPFTFISNGIPLSCLSCRLIPLLLISILPTLLTHSKERLERALLPLGKTKVKLSRLEKSLAFV